ncbi:MAG: hypothetical protein E7314_05700 [Clostridiales bacterium]|nr:hypothetical protein [Clostridiales bacterium]
MKSIKNWFPIKNIEDGIIKTKTGKYCKVLEVSPVNFELKSIKEQENILYRYKTFLNSCDFDIQILVQSKRSNLDDHIKLLNEKIKNEKSQKVINFIREYVNMIQSETLKVAITKKFYIICFASVNLTSKEQIKLDLKEKIMKIENSLAKCQNSIKKLSSKEIIENLYEYMNLNTSKIQPFTMEVK